MSRPEHADLVWSLLGLHHAIDALSTESARAVGVTAQQARLLCALRHGARPTGELAAPLNCDRSNVTGICDRAEQRGLITRQPDPRDRRVALVAWTPEGERLAHAFHEDVKARIAEAAVGFDVDEAALMRAALEHLTATLGGRPGRPADAVSA